MPRGDVAGDRRSAIAILRRARRRTHPNLPIVNYRFLANRSMIKPFAEFKAVLTARANRIKTRTPKGGESSIGLGMSMELIDG